jgi:hypothetical protein
MRKESRIYKFLNFLLDVVGILLLYIGVLAALAFASFTIKAIWVSIQFGWNLI